MGTFRLGFATTKECPHDDNVRSRANGQSTHARTRITSAREWLAHPCPYDDNFHVTSACALLKSGPLPSPPPPPLKPPQVHDFAYQDKNNTRSVLDEDEDLDSIFHARSDALPFVRVRPDIRIAPPVALHQGISNTPPTAQLRCVAYLRIFH